MGFDKVFWFVFKCARDSYVTFGLLWYVCTITLSNFDSCAMTNLIILNFLNFISPNSNNLEQ